MSIVRPRRSSKLNWKQRHSIEYYKWCHENGVKPKFSEKPTQEELYKALKTLREIYPDLT